MPINKEHGDRCGAKCPRHDGEECQVAYAPAGLGKSVFGIPVIDASMRHSHSHTRVVGGGAPSFLLSHSWGGGRRHAYGFGKGTLHSIAEDLYDAIEVGEVDLPSVNRILEGRMADRWRGRAGHLPAPPLSLEEARGETAPRCGGCGEPLRPATASFDGEPTSVGFLPCRCMGARA